jgi:hypothetical protein
MRRAPLPLALAIIAALGGCGARTEPPPFAAERAAGGAAVAIVDRGWHTDLALPAEALTGPLAEVKQSFPGLRYAVFGFGDRVYYMAREETVLGTLEALFPGPGVVLVTALGVPPAAAFGRESVVTLQLSCTELHALGGFIARTMARGAAAALKPLAAGPYPGSLFYASSESYDAFHDCNNWTVAALESAGLPADPAGVFFAGQAMTQARYIAALQRLHPPRTEECQVQNSAWEKWSE